MGKRLKRGQAGNAVQYITRNQALKRLQLKLAHFRRLCILKGIHPREPKKKVQGQNKTYYHVKDINFLAHEPLLAKFRELSAYDRKVKRAYAKQNEALAKRLLALKPQYRIDHLVRERYPTFMDAVRDLDDPLTLVHLFAVLPAESAHGIPRKLVETSQRLSLEWQAYVARTHALRRVFVSVKGFYYQCDIMGQPVTWLVPHAVGQVLPTDVDYRVMLTFLEFYQSMLQFVLFRLYHGIQVKYPPVVDSRMQKAAEELAAVMQELANQGSKPGGGGSAAADLTQQQPLLQLEAPAAPAAAANGAPEHGDEAVIEGFQSGSDDSEGDDSDVEGHEEEDVHEAAGKSAAPRKAEAGRPLVSRAEEQADAATVAGGAVDVDAEDDAAICERLFNGLVFFLGREVPREQLLLVIRAFGGVAAWDGEGSPHTEHDEAITHQVVDRPKQGHVFLSRVYVQPQWLLDSANFRVLVPPGPYAPGCVPPPHLSPFATADDDGYVPDYGKTLQQLQDLAKAVRSNAVHTLKDTTFVGDQQPETPAAQSEEAELQEAERLYTAELAQELQGKVEAEEADATAVDGEAVAKPAAAKPHAAVVDEEEAMASIMMTTKNKRLYEGIQKREAAKKARVMELERRKSQPAKS